jgi:hypothetical protein
MDWALAPEGMQMMTSHIGKENVGKIAERIVANELESYGFVVRDLNLEGLAANVDLLAVKARKIWLIQVKGSSYNETYPNNGWWFQYGYCKNEHIQNEGMKMFNRCDGSFQANIVALVCVRSPHEYQCIVLPAKIAEDAAQINLNHAYRPRKVDGSSHKPSKVWFTLFQEKSRTTFKKEQVEREQKLVRPFLIDRSRRVDSEKREKDEAESSFVLNKVLEESESTALTDSLGG